ncbi:MAG TPA: alpha-ribazole phosphatase [Anaerolineales bacterium]|nr:alpha-ribazole phosphatase [Anaerolineales bacterium]
MKLLLVRHGETDWNLAQRFQGHSDIPLNQVGLQQAKALRDRLSAEPIELIYSSDLERAHETAKIIANGKNKLQTDSRLREVHFGDWEGLTYHEIQEKYPGQLAAWEQDVYKTAPPHGETLEQLAEHTRSILNDLLVNHKAGTILVVAHGGVIKVLICLALNLPATLYWQFQIAPASLSEIAFYPAGAILNFMNDTSHLSPSRESA